MVTLIKYGALSGGEKYNVNQMWIDGLSTDSKPTTTVEGLYIPNGSVYTEVDTGKAYMFDKDNVTWYEVSIGGGGGGGFTPTDAQLAAMNSGIDSTKVQQISTNETNILLKANTSDVNDVSFIDIINTAFKQTNQYAYDTNGVFSIDSSNKWTAFWFDATRIKTIGEIFSNIVFTNTMRYVQFAFFSSKTPSNASKIKYYCYDIDGENYVRNVPVPSNAVLAMLFLRNRDNDGSEYVKGTYFGSLYDVSKDVDVLKKNAPPASGYSYSGEKIKLDNYFTYKSLDIACYGQDGCISGDYFFSFNNQGSCKVYNIISKSNVVNFNLDQYSTIKPHCNAVVFGGTKFDNDDVFPLLYVNAYNAPNIAHGTLYVHRILTDENGVPTGTSLIQTITIGFTDQPIWDDGNNLSPYGNFFVDTDNGFLYAYVPKTTQNVTRFFKFPLPDISIGSVTFEESDIIEYFDTDYILYPQGNCCNSGKAYILSGISVGTGFLSVVNLESKRIVSRIDFYKSIGAEWEPEVIDVYKGKLLLGQSPLLEFTF